MYYVYILKCCDGTLYCGYTNDVEKRFETHQSGKGAKYTRGRLPLELVYTEEFETKSEAMKRECAIKKLTRTKKMELINSSQNIIDSLE